MDGDGHNARAFPWTEDEDTGKAPRAFDPAAVLRAIEDEDDEPAPPQEPAEAGGDEDFGAALRAAFAIGEAGQDAEATDEDIPEDTVPDDEEDEGLSADDYEDRLALSDDHDEVEDAHDVEAEYVEADDPGFGSAEVPDMDAGDDLPPSFAAPSAPAFARVDDPDAPDRKPRIALMGEFSAGKSTLSNLLIGSAPLPMKVTATQLPPVWISWGDGEPYVEDLDGETRPIGIAELAGIDPAETRVVRIFAKSEILERCDIIDMPGISDPNMASDVWERVIGKADGVIWCTHATQAWRQSEASVWESLDPRLHESSLLLVTRFDKLHSESDRARVLRRVERETEGLFSARLPISLTGALAAGDDPDLLDRSGATAFKDRLVAMLDDLGASLGRAPKAPDGDARMRDTLARDGLVARIDGGRPERGITPSRILPRRIRPASELAPGPAAHPEPGAGH
jgi:hypothetical protein